MKKCPFCAEDIQDAAVICRFCNRELPVQQATTADTTTCPFCKAVVPKGSKVCPSCHGDISGIAAKEPVGATPATPAPTGTIDQRRVLHLSVAVVGLLLTFVLSAAGLGIFMMWWGIGSAMRGSPIARWGGGLILALILGAFGSGVRHRTVPRSASSIANPSSETSGSTSSGSAAAPEPARTAPPPAPAPEPTYQLALISSRGYESESGGYYFVEGQVRNVSDQPLKNVAAVSTWYDKDGNFITTYNALINYNPILPGQLSPFKTITRGNPAMSKYIVEFKTLFGGGLSVDDQRKKGKGKK